jgi:hypothetical protein
LTSDDPDFRLFIQNICSVILRSARIPGVVFTSDDGVVMVLKVGWKFGLFFDLEPLRPLDVEAMERSLGQLWRTT